MVQSFTPLRATIHGIGMGIGLKFEIKRGGVTGKGDEWTCPASMQAKPQASLHVPLFHFLLEQVIARRNGMPARRWQCVGPYRWCNLLKWNRQTDRQTDGRIVASLNAPNLVGGRTGGERRSMRAG